MKLLIVFVMVLTAFLTACNSPEYLEATHYWDEGKIRVDWKWSTTSARSGEKGERSLCVAAAKITNLHNDTSIRINSIVLVLQNQHELTLHKESETIDIVLEPKQSEEVEMKFWVASGIQKDTRSLSARLGFKPVSNYDALLSGIPVTDSEDFLDGFE